jgi:hypothetical protein
MEEGVLYSFIGKNISKLGMIMGAEYRLVLPSPNLNP